VNNNFAWTWYGSNTALTLSGYIYYGKGVFIAIFLSSDFYHFIFEIANLMQQVYVADNNNKTIT
jgi:hypothetical protein